MRELNPNWFAEWGDEFSFHVHPVGSLNLPVLIEYRISTVTIKKVILHLHGGPESYERGEIRYPGAYEEQVKAGAVYLGWNYPGSVGFGKKWQKYPWKRWKKILIQEWILLKKWIKKYYQVDESDLILVGASFGAMVALVIAEHEKNFGKVILVSPLLSLRNHVNRVSEQDQMQLAWFKKRFGKADLESLEFVARDFKIPSKISFILSGNDEVLGLESAKKFISKLDSSNRIYRSLIQVNCKHSPRTPTALLRRARWIASELGAD